MSITQSPLDLQDHKGRADKLQAKVAELTLENEGLAADLKVTKETVEEQKGEIESLKEELKESDARIEELEPFEDRPDIAVAVHAFLDEITRPVGTQHFEIPQAPCIDRAIIRMHDAIGRPL